MSEIPADLDLACPSGFVKSLSPRMTVFKETLKKQQLVSSSQALGYFQRANAVGGAALKVWWQQTLSQSLAPQPSTPLHKLLTTTLHAHTKSTQNCLEAVQELLTNDPSGPSDEWRPGRKGGLFCLPKVCKVYSLVYAPTPECRQGLCIHPWAYMLWMWPGQSCHQGAQSLSHPRMVPCLVQQQMDFVLGEF